jgi:predicted amidohydrolase
MFPTGFSMDAERIAQPRGGESEAFLRERAAALDLWIVGSVAERGEAGPQNVALVVSPRGTVSRYAKIHPFSYSGEHLRYAAGDRVVTVTIDGLRVTPLVCYDLRFPEPFRLAASETDAFVLVANWPDARREHWRTLVKARAIENLAYVLAVNRVGEGGKLRYAGDSAVVSPWGETLVEGGPEEAVLVCEVDPEAVRQAREKFPFLDDRRPGAYKR